MKRALFSVFFIIVAACGGPTNQPTQRAIGTATPLPIPQPTQANGPTPTRILLAHSGSGALRQALTAQTGSSTATTGSTVSYLDITDVVNGGGQVVGSPLPANLTVTFEDGKTQTYANPSRYAVFVGGYAPFNGIDIDVVSSDPNWHASLLGYYTLRHDTQGTDGLWYANYAWNQLLNHEYGRPCCSGWGQDGNTDTTDYFTHAGTVTWPTIPNIFTTTLDGWYQGIGDGQMLTNVGFPADAQFDQNLYWAFFFLNPVNPNDTTPPPAFTISGIRFHPQ